MLFKNKIECGDLSVKCFCYFPSCQWITPLMKSSILLKCLRTRCTGKRILSGEVGNLNKKELSPILQMDNKGSCTYYLRLSAWSCSLTESHNLAKRLLWPLTVRENYNADPNFQSFRKRTTLFGNVHPVTVLTCN